MAIKNITDLMPDKENARSHNPRNVGMIVDALHEVGAARSIVIDEDGLILAGNATIKAAALAGIKQVRVVEADGETIIAVRRSGLTAEQKKRLAYFDNRTSELADWSPDQLLADLESGLDLSGLFGKAELDELLKGLAPEPPEDPGPQIDKAAELQEKWQVAQGDIWQCGDDLWLICGDCREPEVWQRLLGAAGVEKVNGVFTSPPYAEQRKKQYGGVPTDKYVDWWEAVQENVRANLANDGSFFVNLKPHCEDGERVLYVMDLVLAMKRRWGWRFVDELCWTRNPFPGGYDNRFKNGFEPIFHFCIDRKIAFNKMGVADNRSPDTHIYGRSGNQSGFVSSVCDTGTGVLPTNIINAETGEVNIGTQAQPATFPVALPDFFIRAYSDPGDTWADNFMGSGTTGVAAHQKGRRFVGIEVLEKYCAVTLERWVDLASGEPQLIG